MTKNLMAMAAAVALSAPALIAIPAAAQTSNNQSGYRDNDPRYHNNDSRYQGSDSRYPCKKSSGTTGLVAGGVGGGLLGHALGGGTLGTIAGAGGGALLGRHLDKKHDEAQNRKNGC